MKSGVRSIVDYRLHAAKIGAVRFVLPFLFHAQHRRYHVRKAVYIRKTFAKSLSRWMVETDYQASGHLVEVSQPRKV